jgi:hypothetical protein
MASTLTVVVLRSAGSGALNALATADVTEIRSSLGRAAAVVA